MVSDKSLDGSFWQPGHDPFVRLAALALVAAPWFWIADFLIDLPTTAACVLYLISVARAKAKLPASKFWLTGFVLLWLLFLVGAATGIHRAEAIVLAGLWIRHPVFLIVCLTWLAPKSLDYAAGTNPSSTHRIRYQIWGPVAWSFTIAAAFVSFDALVQWYFGLDLLGIPKHGPTRLTGPMNEPIVGFFLTQMAPVLMAFSLAGVGPWRSLSSRPTWLRWGAGCVLALAIIFTSILSGERLFAAWMAAGTISSMLLVSVSRPSKRPRKLPRVFDVAVIAGVLALVIGCAAIFGSQNLRERYVSHTVAELGEISRAYSEGEIVASPSAAYANIHLRALQAISDAPWTGHGMRNFRFYCPTLLNIPNNNINGCSTHPHQTWLNIAVAGGMPSLALASLLALCFVSNRVAAMLRSRHDTRRLLLAFMPLWAFAPVMLSPLVSEGFFVNFTENLVWGGIALAMSAERIASASAVNSHPSPKTPR